MATTEIDLGRYKLGWSDQEQYVFKPRKGLNEDIVNEMSWMKGEPDWMRRFRLRALSLFERKPMLDWFAKNMPTIDFDDVYYYIKPTNKQVNDWDMLPDNVKATYEKLGIPEAERKFLAGVTAGPPPGGVVPLSIVGGGWPRSGKSWARAAGSESPMTALLP